MSIASAISAGFLQVASAMNARAGRVGMSAYDQAKQNGFVGTFADWQASLPGQDEDYAAYLLSLLGPVQTAGVATETQAGVTQLATFAEAQAGTSAMKALSVLRASDWLLTRNDAIAVLTGRRRGTEAQRQALTSAQVIDGLLFYATDSGLTWKYLATPTSGSARWIVWDWPNIPASSGYQPYIASLITAYDMSMVGGVVMLNYTVTQSSGLQADTSYLQLKPPFRPVSTTHHGGFTNSGSGQRAPATFRAETDGNTYLTSNNGIAVATFATTMTFRAAQ